MIGRAGLAAAALLVAAAAAPAVAESTRPAEADCTAPPALAGTGRPLPHSAARVAQREPLTIVAVGSSSTQGVGASSPDLAYPSQLAAELKQRFPESSIRVVNRGKGGEDVPEELARLDRDVIAEHPDLVIWQVGTNAVLRRDDLAADGELIERGIGLLQQGGSDVVLMDLQYAPRVVARPAYAEMEQLIANLSKSMRVGLFRRFDIMRHWQEAQPQDDARAVGPDGLHMNDRGYRCLAAELAKALAADWATERGTPAAVARLGRTRTVSAPLPEPAP